MKHELKLAQEAAAGASGHAVAHSQVQRIECPPGNITNLQVAMGLTGLGEKDKYSNFCMSVPFFFLFLMTHTITDLSIS